MITYQRGIVGSTGPTGPIGLVANAGVAQPAESTLNFNGFTIADNPGNSSTDVLLGPTVLTSATPPTAANQIPNSAGAGTNAVAWASAILTSQLPATADQVTAYISPSGDTGGNADLAAIQAALNKGGIVALAPGRFFISGPLTLPSYAHLRGAGAIRTGLVGLATGFGTIIQVTGASITAGATFTATTNSTTTLATVSSFAGLFVGMPLSGTGIPRGTYIAAINTGASTITLSQAATASASGVTITPYNPLINVAGSAYSSISRIAFDALSASTANSIPCISDCTGSYASFLRVEDCYFNNFGGQNICHTGEVSYFTRNRADNSNSHNVHILNTASVGGSAPASDNFVLFNDSGAGTGTGSAPGAIGDALCIEGGGFNTVIGNEFYNFAHGIQVINGQGNRIEGNRCEKHDFDGIKLTGASCQWNIVSGNFAFNNGYVSSATGLNVLASANQNLIVGNWLGNVASAPGGTNSAYGILVAGSATRNRFNSNFISNTATDGIHLSGALYNAFDGNTIDTVGVQGVNIDPTSTNNHFSNTLVMRASQTTNGSGSGILVQGTANVITDAVIDAAGAANKVGNGIRFPSGGNNNIVIGGSCTSAQFASSAIANLATGNIISSAFQGYAVPVVTLVAGSSTVVNTSITAASVIRLSSISAGGTVGALSVTLTAGTGFVINSTSGSDTSKVAYEIVSF